MSFVVPGPPIPKARARVVSRKGASGKTTTRSFTPERSAQYEEHIKAIAFAARTHHRKWPHEDKAARFGLSVRVFRSIDRGDLDNYIKAVSDACNRVLWADDSQVRRLGECSIGACEKGKERIEVDVWTLDQ